MLIQGTVINGDSGEPVAGASVEAWAGNLMLSGIAANNSGFFSLEVPGTPDTLRVSSASFIPTNFNYPESAGQSQFVLRPNVVEGENIILTSTRPKKKKVPVLVWVAVIALAVLVKKR